MKNYNYEWKTLDEILRNKKIKVCFRGYSETSLDDITDGASNKDYKAAHELWLKLIYMAMNLLKEHLSQI